MRKIIKKNIAIGIVLALVILGFIYSRNNSSGSSNYVLTGAFITDVPSRKDIESFKKNYGKNPFFVMVFVDWESFVKKEVLEDIFSQGSYPVVTWEPWYWETKEGVDPEAILGGEFDSYIRDFAKNLAQFEDKVYLRFAHEMNGDWYPWSSALIGAPAYKKMYRYIKDKFDDLKIDNVSWVFSINWENIPEDNYYYDSYPGAGYVNYIGLDGYNWGNSQSWSRWMSFRQIFSEIHQELIERFDKDIIITEFSSTSQGGDKAQWIKEALSDMKKMERLKGFILFNVDKETDWKFSPQSHSGRALREKLQDSFFKGRLN